MSKNQELHVLYNMYKHKLTIATAVFHSTMVMREWRIAESHNHTSASYMVANLGLASYIVTYTILFLSLKLSDITVLTNIIIKY